MPRFEAFRALRYSASLPLGDVTAPPYDVLSDHDVDVLLARHERNIAAVDVPRGPDDGDRYARAAEVLRSWISEGTLERDPEPSFTLYRLGFVDETGLDRSTVGVLGALEVVDEGAGGVLPHERTTPKATSDRLDLTRATRANLSPVWGLSLTPGLTELLAAPGDPIGSFVDDDGVTHSVERVTRPDRVAAITAAIASSPVLIADGHHRYAVSRTYRDERRADDGAGPWDLTLAYVGELVDDQLSVAAIHRLYRRVDPVALLAHLGEWFDLAPAGRIGPSFATEVTARGALCFVHGDGTGTWMRPIAARFGDVRDLDGAVLEHALASFPHDIGYQHGVERTVEAVATGTAAAAVLIRPTSIGEIRRTADEGLLMPPKSTFFTPKLRTGLVLRTLG